MKVWIATNQTHRRFREFKSVDIEHNDPWYGTFQVGPAQSSTSVTLTQLRLLTKAGWTFGIPIRTGYAEHAVINARVCVDKTNGLLEIQEVLDDTEFCKRFVATKLPPWIEPAMSETREIVDTIQKSSAYTFKYV